ncbi:MULTISPECIES: peptidylprolyl isomerase [Oxalobacteraceae]|uniref:peptidylprolyl isomerase n=1 Tax=Oxalobacteraceae TaxID=75682 RepID=UPI0002AE8B15|nr:MULTISPECIES: peptidylprolyl isomerase [Oxalobacteraceae]ELX08556.1 putative parvulin-type peptidyl-prolyl cis-trans isomerase [Janthinobacterium sp. HH01]OEZ64027.1 putative parvulin-type peptidyl-prolyl cis-trans isomerase precursor [Duganella sp. HH105]OFA06822.1 putative parvulin-type peptidyl-prolyl cis-trans isomerase precursor [Duganella sp. HH101]
MMLKPTRLLLALIAVVAAPVFAQNVATVNGKAIPAAKVDQMVKQVVAQGQQPDSPQLREMVKKELIGREVMIQEADKQGFGTKPEVKAAIENARQSIIINAMLADYVKKNPIKDTEIKAEYDKYKAAMGEKEYHSRHILVATEQEAKDIIAKLKAGGKFEELAKVSKDGSANNGGDLGWMAPGKLVKPFADAMIALKNGEITQTPVKTEYGYHVIKLEESRATKLPAVEEVKGQIAEALQQRKIAAFRDELTKKAKVQ